MALGITRCVQQENDVLFPYSNSFLDQACSIKMAGYSPHSFFACMDPESRSKNTQKKNLVNIQPCYPTLGQ